MEVLNYRYNKQSCVCVCMYVCMCVCVTCVYMCECMCILFMSSTSDIGFYSSASAITLNNQLAKGHKPVF